VIDVIHANSELGQSNAAKALSGKLSEKVNRIREKAMAFAAELSAIADYPEEMDELSAAEINSRIDGIAADVKEMTDGFKRGFDGMAYSLDAAIFIEALKERVEKMRQLSQS